MKIGFFGAQGTGKTVLIEKMMGDPYFASYKNIVSRSRVANDAGLPINQEATRLSQLLVTTSRVAADLNTPGSVMSDRTPIDSLAYSLYQQLYVWDEDPMDEFYWKTSFEIVAPAMAMYDHLFYFPVYWAPVYDGVRKTDPQYQKEMDSLMKKIADDMEVNYHTMPELTIDGRLGWLKATLEFDSL